jgi:hypothetical protein
MGVQGSPADHGKEVLGLENERMKEKRIGITWDRRLIYVYLQ